MNMTWVYTDARFLFMVYIAMLPVALDGPGYVASDGRMSNELEKCGTKQT
jgi:hypothetical protein